MFWWINISFNCLILLFFTLIAISTPHFSLTLAFGHLSLLTYPFAWLWVMNASIFFINYQTTITFLYFLYVQIQISFWHLSVHIWCWLLAATRKVIGNFHEIITCVLKALSRVCSLICLNFRVVTRCLHPYRILCCFAYHRIARLSALRSWYNILKLFLSFYVCIIGIYTA